MTHPDRRERYSIMPTRGGSDMNKYLSQEEKNTLKLEFAYQG